MNVLRNLTLSFAFYSKIPTLSVFLKKSNLFPETYLFFIKSKTNLKILRKLPISVAFHSKIATFSHFKMSSFFWRIYVLFLTAKVWTFWEMLIVQLNSSAKLRPPAYFYNSKIFVRKTHFFKFKKAWSLKFLRTVTISVDSTASLLHLPFWRTSVFLEKPKYSLILPNPKVWKFGETLLIPSHCTANLLPSSIFENFEVFFGKPIHLCKKPNLWTFWENSQFRLHSKSNWLTVSVAVDIKMAKLSCFQKTRFLFRKNQLVSQSPNFRVILLIQSILRQVCYS